MPQLLDHELQMQQAGQSVATAPDAIGRLVLERDQERFRRWDKDKRRPRTSYKALVDGKRAGALYLNVFVFRHRLGTRIPPSFDERLLCSLFFQVVCELQEYSKFKAHYRDFNVGNVLCEVDGGTGKPLLDPSGFPILVLCDHGNMSLANEARGSDEHVLTAMAAVAQDDARSANRMFLPSGMAYIKPALDLLMDPEAEEDWPEQRLQVRLYSHSYIDDLESAIYLFLWLSMLHRVHVSPIWGDKHADTLEKWLCRNDYKEKRWESAPLWKSSLKSVCHVKAEGWRQLLVQLRACIVKAQLERRELIKADTLAPDGELSDPEGTGFKACKASLKACFELHTFPEVAPPAFAPAATAQGKAAVLGDTKQRLDLAIHKGALHSCSRCWHSSALPCSR